MSENTANDYLTRVSAYDGGMYGGIVGDLADGERGFVLALREQGRGPSEPGRLKAVKGIGWWVDEYDMAQVSMNLDDYTVTPPHAAPFETVVHEVISWQAPPPRQGQRVRVRCNPEAMRSPLGFF